MFKKKNDKLKKNLKRENMYQYSIDKKENNITRIEEEETRDEEPQGCNCLTIQFRESIPNLMERLGLKEITVKDKAERTEYIELTLLHMLRTMNESGLLKTTEANQIIYNRTLESLKREIIGINYQFKKDHLSKYGKDMFYRIEQNI